MEPSKTWVRGGRFRNPALGVTATVIAFLVGVLRPPPVTAMNHVVVDGSQAVEQVLKDVLGQCPSAVVAGVTYGAGEGSTDAENAMTGPMPTQTVAPMSRPLNPTAGVCAKGSTAEALVVALDGIAVVASASEAKACGGGLVYSPSRSFDVTDVMGHPAMNCPGCDPGTNHYRLSDWRDVLALIYAGKSHDGSVDCAGDVRRSLVNDWGPLFETGCTASACTQLRHAFRRGDDSSSTEALLQLLDLPELPTDRIALHRTAGPIAFCNAYNLGNIFRGDSDYQDQDPIRRSCQSSEQVCGITPAPPGSPPSLGLVLVIEVPADLPADRLYPPVACTPGKFMLMSPGSTRVTTCPNGLGLLFGRCFQPYQDLGGGAFNANCLAPRSPHQGFAPNGMDGRNYNLVVKDAAGRYIRDNNNRFITGAFYRLHTTRVMPGGGSPCAAIDPAQQLGCLVQASPCSIGSAPREAADQSGVAALMIKGVAPTQTNIEKIFTAPGDPMVYPLSRRLYLSSVLGFADPVVRDGELALARCFSNSAIVNPIVTARGYVPVPGGIRCEDFDEKTRCGAAVNVDACAANPPGVASE